MGKKIKSEILGHSGTFPLLGESESVAKYGDWLGICALHLIHPSVNTHTHPEQWAAILLRRTGSSWGFGALP